MAKVQLPEELLEQIVWGLKLPVYARTDSDDNHIARKTLFSCMLASRALSRLAQPVLYLTINQCLLERFVQCCARRPDLAGQVRELRSSDVDTLEDSTEGLDDMTTWRDYNYEICSLWGVIYHIPLSGYAHLLCTRLETLVVEKNHFSTSFPPREFLAECVELRRRWSRDYVVPLAALRTFVMEAEPQHDLSMAVLEDKSWFSCIVQLPDIETVKLNELNAFIIDSQSLPSKLRSLTIGTTTKRGGYSGQDALGYSLIRLLKHCPLLKSLNVTMRVRPEQGQACEYWASLGLILSRHGLSLRNVRFYDPFTVVQPSRHGALINLTSMTKLRSLTLPIEALLSEPRGKYRIPDFARDRKERCYPYQLLPDDEEWEGGDLLMGVHAPGEGLNTPTVPLSENLPCSLRKLRIIDDSHLWSDAVRLDRELRSVMLSEEFVELHTIMVRRDDPPTKHVKNIGWHAQSYRSH